MGNRDREAASHLGGTFKYSSSSCLLDRMALSCYREAGDKTAKLWDAKSGQLLRTLEGQFEITSGRLPIRRTAPRWPRAAAITQSNCGTPRPGGCCAPCRGIRVGSGQLRSLPDGSRLLSGSDGTLRVWEPAEWTAATYLGGPLKKRHLRSLFAGRRHGGLGQRR